MNPHPQQVWNTETTVTTLTLASMLPQSNLMKYVHTLGKTEDKDLQILKLCYEEPTEEVAIVDTFEMIEEAYF